MKNHFKNHFTLFAFLFVWFLFALTAIAQFSNSAPGTIGGGTTFSNASAGSVGAGSGFNTNSSPGTVTGTPTNAAPVTSLGPTFNYVIADTNGNVISPSNFNSRAAGLASPLLTTTVSNVVSLTTVWLKPTLVDDTTNFQYYLCQNISNVDLELYGFCAYYVNTNLFPNWSTRVHGNGGTVIYAGLGVTNFVFNYNTNSVNEFLENFVLDGQQQSNYMSVATLPSGYALYANFYPHIVETSVGNRNGIHYNLGGGGKFTQVDVRGFNGSGMVFYNVWGQSAQLTTNTTINLCKAYNDFCGFAFNSGLWEQFNYAGIPAYIGPNGSDGCDYCTVENCDAYNCAIGLDDGAGNNKIVHCNLNQDQVGWLSYGGGTIAGHGLVSATTFNHNTAPFEIFGQTTGMMIDGCLFLINVQAGVIGSAPSPCNNIHIEDGQLGAVAITNSTVLVKNNFIPLTTSIATLMTNTILCDAASGIMGSGNYYFYGDDGSSSRGFWTITNGIESWGGFNAAYLFGNVPLIALTNVFNGSTPINLGGGTNLNAAKLVGTVPIANLLNTNVYVSLGANTHSIYASTFTNSGLTCNLGAGTWKFEYKVFMSGDSGTLTLNTIQMVFTNSVTIQADTQSGDIGPTGSGTGGSSSQLLFDNDYNQAATALHQVNIGASSGSFSWLYGNGVVVAAGNFSPTIMFQSFAAGQSSCWAGSYMLWTRIQ